jgi:SAM-dependent methyltransferase
MLWHKSPDPAAALAAPRKPARGALAHPSKALRIFVSEIRDREAPQLLDIGQVIGTNIEFFARMGCKVFVRDLVAERITEANQGKLPERLVPGTRWGGFPYPDEQFDGVLAWDLLDYFARDEVPSVIGEIFRVLKKEALLLGLFCKERADQPEPCQRYRIVDNGILEHEPVEKGPAAKLLVSRMRNREILDAFVPHRVMHFIMLGNNMREIVVRK